MNVRRTVLLADANEEFRALARRIIDASEEFTAAGAVGDGAEALRLAEQTHPDLVVMDVVLPGLDGFGVLKRLREQEQMPKVILVSAFCSDPVVAEAVELGAAYFLTKPVEPEALLDRIFDRESSDGSRPVSIGSQAGTRYWKGQISYLCWGLSPRDCFVLRYDHTRVEEDVMIRMAESVG